MRRGSPTRLLVIGIAVLAVIVAALLLAPSATQSSFSQDISYSDFSVEKAAQISELSGTRTETYSFSLANPIVAFVIIPKSVAGDVSLISTSGDFSTEAILADPVLMITSKEYSPGKKTFTIRAPAGDASKTTVLMAFPLKEYEAMSGQEKEAAKAVAISVSERAEENFEIENSLAVMQEFADRMGTAGFGAAKDRTGIISFAADEATGGSFGNSGFFDALIGAMSSSVKDSYAAYAPTETEYATTITVEFAQDDAEIYDLPDQIDLYVSDSAPEDSFKFKFINPEDPLSTEAPSVSVQGDSEKFLGAVLGEISFPFEITVSAKIPNERASSMAEGETMDAGSISVGFYLQSTYEIPVVLHFGACEQMAGDASRLAAIGTEGMDNIRLGCYADKVEEKKATMEALLAELEATRENIIKDLNARIPQGSTSSFYSEEMTRTLQGSGYESLASKFRSEMVVDSFGFALMRAMDMMSDKKRVFLSDCSWLSGEEGAGIGKTLLVPKNLDSGGFQINLFGTEKTEVYANEALMKEYYGELCAINAAYGEAQEMYNGAKMILIDDIVQDAASDENTGLNEEKVLAAAKLFEGYSMAKQAKLETLKLISSNKLVQIGLIDKTLTYTPTGGMRTAFAPSNDANNGWQYESEKDAVNDTYALSDQAESMFGSILTDLAGNSGYFDCNSAYCAFYTKHFALMRDMKSGEAEVQKTNSWFDQLLFVKSVDDYYKNLAAHPDAGEKEKAQMLALAKEARNALLRQYLLEHFDAELYNDIELLKYLEEGVTGQALSYTEWYELFWKPAKIGEFYGEKIFGENPTEDDKKKMLEYLVKIQDKRLELEKLRILAEKEFDLAAKSGKDASLDFFSSMKGKYGQYADYKDLFAERIFVKALTLEKELASFNEGEGAKSSDIIAFHKKALEQDLTNAMSYETAGIYPIARIKYDEVVALKQGKDNNPLYDAALVAKAEKYAQDIKPNLTWFESLTDKIVAWFKGSDSVSTNMQYATVDYRSSASIWSERIDSITDLRYWLGFGVAGKALVNGVTMPIYRSLFPTVFAAAARVSAFTAATWKYTGGKLMTLFAKSSKYIPQSVLEASFAAYKSAIAKMSILNLRNYERAMLTSLYKKMPRFATVLGSKFETYVDYTVAKALGKDFTYSVLKQRVLYDNILKRVGSVRELYGAGVTDSALRIINDPSFPEATSSTMEFADGTVLTTGKFLDAEGTKYVVISEARKIRGGFLGDKTITKTRVFEVGKATAQESQAISALAEEATTSPAELAYDEAALILSTASRSQTAGAKNAAPALEAVHTAMAIEGAAAVSKTGSAGALEALSMGGVVPTRQGFVVLYGGRSAAAEAAYAADYSLAAGTKTFSSESYEALVAQRAAARQWEGEVVRVSGKGGESMTVNESALPPSKSFSDAKVIEVDFTAKRAAVPEEPMMVEIKCASPCEIGSARGAGGQKIDVSLLKGAGDYQIKLSKTQLIESGNVIEIPWATKSASPRISIRKPTADEIAPATSGRKVGSAAANIVPAGTLREGEALIKFGNDSLLEIVTNSPEARFIVNGTEVSALSKAAAPQAGGAPAHFIEEFSYRPVSLRKIIFGAKNSNGVVDFPVNKKNMPMITVVPEEAGEGMIVQSGSRSIRDNARIIRSDGTIDIVDNIPVNEAGEKMASAGKRHLMKNGDALEIGGQVFVLTNKEGYVTVLSGAAEESKTFMSDHIAMGQKAYSSTRAPNVVIPDERMPLIHIDYSEAGFDVSSGSRVVAVDSSGKAVTRAEAKIIHSDGTETVIKNGDIDAAYAMADGEYLEVLGNRFRIQKEFDVVEQIKVTKIRPAEVIEAPLPPIAADIPTQAAIDAGTSLPSDFARWAGNDALGRSTAGQFAESIGQENAILFANQAGTRNGGVFLYNLGAEDAAIFIQSLSGSSTKNNVMLASKIIRGEASNANDAALFVYLYRPKAAAGLIDGYGTEKVAASLENLIKVKKAGGTLADAAATIRNGKMTISAKFSCSSPCVWEATKGSVQIFDTHAEAVDVVGDFKKKYVVSVETVIYSPTAPETSLITDGLTKEEIEIVRQAMVLSSFFATIQPTANARQVVRLWMSEDTMNLLNAVEKPKPYVDLIQYDLIKRGINTEKFLTIYVPDYYDPKNMGEGSHFAARTREEAATALANYPELRQNLIDGLAERGETVEAAVIRYADGTTEPLSNLLNAEIAQQAAAPSVEEGLATSSAYKKYDAPVEVQLADDSKLVVQGKLYAPNSSNTMMLLENDNTEIAGILEGEDIGKAFPIGKVVYADGTESKVSVIKNVADKWAFENRTQSLGFLDFKADNGAREYLSYKIMEGLGINAPEIRNTKLASGEGLCLSEYIPGSRQIRSPEGYAGAEMIDAVYVLLEKNDPQYLVQGSKLYAFDNEIALDSAYGYNTGQGSYDWMYGKSYDDYAPSVQRISQFVADNPEKIRQWIRESGFEIASEEKIYAHLVENAGLLEERIQLMTQTYEPKIPRLLDQYAQ